MREGLCNCDNHKRYDDTRPRYEDTGVILDYSEAKCIAGVLSDCTATKKIFFPDSFKIYKKIGEKENGSKCNDKQQRCKNKQG